MSRQPTRFDFPAYLQLSVIPPPSSQPATNVLIFFHGLGDTMGAFTHLAKQSSLPETSSIVVQAPSPLPFDLGGFHWGDDITFDQSSGTMDYDTGFDKSRRVLQEDVMEKGLINKCGYKPRNILLFGFGQGGMAALAAASALKMELGGIVSIGGPLPATLHPDSSHPKNQTPMIVLGGSSNTLITQTAIGDLKKAFQAVEYVKWPRAGDRMPTNRDEMLPIMKFFARRLQSRSGVPEGSVEIGSNGV
ncbi:MAG: hypothetical protein L6R40_006123 [Gallowayella cf. fulva]|nr:MAG: hypothetical protein L6R40_006123 [Xanthomendoza cf. fulva]